MPGPARPAAEAKRPAAAAGRVRRISLPPSNETLAGQGACEWRAVLQLKTIFEREPELIIAMIDQSTDRTRQLTLLAAARAAAAENNDYADLQYFAAQAALKIGRPVLAERLVSRALEINPHYRDALLLAVRIAAARHQPQRAIALLQRAIAQGAEYPDAYVLLGNLHRDAGELLLARRAYERALQLNGSLTAPRCALAALPGSGWDGGGRSNELPA